MLEDIKKASVEFIKRFTDELLDCGNPTLIKFNKREPKEKIAIVTGRLIDNVEEMLKKWRTRSHPAPLPVIILGFAKGYSSTDLSYGGSVSDKKFIVQDADGHYFYLRLDKHDLRMQAVVITQDEETAFSISSQFKLFCQEFENQRLKAYSIYNDKPYAFPMRMEDSNIFGADQQIPEQDNLTITVFDLTFHCNTPYFLGDVVNDTPYLPLVTSVDFSVTNEKNKEQEDLYNALITTGDTSFIFTKEESVSADASS